MPVNHEPQSTAALGPIRRVGIVAKRHLYEAARLLDELVDWLATREVTPILDLDTAHLAGRPDVAALAQADLPGAVDLMVVLGGDGTLLGMADRIAEAQARVPILGVNFGSLGFLTEITLPELFPALASALDGSARVDERLMVRATTRRRDGHTAFCTVLNDVVITKGALSRIIDLSVTVDAQFVARFKADGLILATPTGSTAYNLAAGGPIVHPSVEAFVITPIAPHTLTNRPIAIPSSSTVVIQPVGDVEPDAIFATFDGQRGFPLHADDAVEIRQADEPTRVIRAQRSYFDVLRQKLRWAER
ncbi:MAG: NAD(+)/NADH kinase [Acidobacteria bacterium]|nr:NAD(+)/NADH kinase [Acidobacteriota bacterium]